MDLTDIYRNLHPKEENYTLISNVYGTFSKIQHMLIHKTSLTKFRKIEIMSSIFLDYKDLKPTSKKNSKVSNS